MCQNITHKKQGVWTPSNDTMKGFRPSNCYPLWRPSKWNICINKIWPKIWFCWIHDHNFLACWIPKSDFVSGCCHYLVLFLVVWTRYLYRRDDFDSYGDKLGEFIVISLHSYDVNSEISPKTNKGMFGIKRKKKKGSSD